MTSNAAQDFAERVAATYGERPHHHGRELRVRCPCHEAEGFHKPSLAIWLGGDGHPKLKCMTGCPREAVRAALRARGVPVSGPAAISVEDAFAARQAREARRVEQLTIARDIILKSRGVLEHDPAARYLKARHLDVPTTGDMFTLRVGDDPVHKSCPALIGVICDLSTIKDGHAQATGMQSLSLMQDGTPRLGPDGKKFRSIMGTQSGFAVPLGKPGPNLVVGEGIESTLAAMKLLDIGFGAAVLSASNMAPLVIPEWVRKIVIAADNDPAGIAAAQALQKSVKGLVLINYFVWGAAGSGWDAADEWAKKQETSNAV